MIFIGNSVPTQASRVGPVSTEWMQTNTRHFRIIHDKNQQDLGRYYAEIAEIAYSNLSTVFSTLPEVITVVLADNTDDSNGNATVFPYPLIFAFPVQVGQQGGLSEASEWGKELFTHELVHVAQLYPYSATTYKIARALFGSVISPHLLMPGWWKEGMAVEMETQFSPRGRTRSYLQDAQIRSYVTKNKLKDFTLAEANEDLITWPYGNRRYFFGSMLMSQIAYEGNLQNKPQTIGDIVLDQSHRWPYFINAPVKKTLGANYTDIYNRTLEAYSKNSQQQIKELSKVPLSQVVPLNADLIQSRFVKYSDAHDIVGLIATTDMDTQIQFYKDNVLLEFKKLPTNDLGSFDFHPIDAKIIYNKTHQVNLKQNFSDLYIYDLSQGKSERLTFKERARDPIYSPDGNKVLFTHTGNGLTELKSIDIASKKITSLLAGTPKSRINSYTFKGDNQVLYTLRDETGNQHLHILNLDTLISQKIIAPTQIRFLKYKDPILYFISTENEVLNIYQARVSKGQLKDIQPLTHLMTGALNFDIDTKNEIVYSTVIGENGPYVSKSEFLPAGTILPKIKNEILDRYQIKTDEVADATATSVDYSPWPYLYPRYWIPFISNNITGTGLLYQAMTSARDPIGLHTYEAQINYDSFSRKAGYAFNYLNSQLSWDWNLSAYQTQQLISLDSYVRKNSYSFSIMPDTFSLSENFVFTIGTSINKTDDSFISTSHWGGYIQMLYSSIKQRPHHYFPMTGYSVVGRYQALADQNEQPNSRYGSYSQALMSLTSYNHLFLPKNHTLMVKLDGLYTFEDMAIRFGTSNLSLPVEPEALPLFLIRGYQAGQFLGNQMATVNLEYRFPLVDISNGGDTTPLFFKYLTAGVVADALSTKGFGYSTKINDYQALKWSQNIYSAGAELRLSTTLGYILPLNFIYGVYFPLSEDFSDEKVVNALSIQIGGF